MDHSGLRSEKNCNQEKPHCLNFDSRAKNQGFFGKFFERSSPEVVSGVKKFFLKKLILPFELMLQGVQPLEHTFFFAQFFTFWAHSMWMPRTFLRRGKYGSVENSVILIWPRCAFLKKTQIDQNFWTKRFLFGCEMYGLDTGLKQKSVRVKIFNMRLLAILSRQGLYCRIF